ncbi:BglG family transcription antiterminator [Metabacillus litoralis]|uniref:BglG family transcription antiterminator n=1 Tax=Metabacillus TaxID=2675233 RepID=UPI000EF59CCE|nr:BglG family transcription antiterminator [Metabacillus litoralis]MCM3411727.1 BglG family transcription antiterminator [Metabacillus litoralis]UHA61151.1 BglG family transcription antiterminator [Metabacillus litoralis]
MYLDERSNLLLKAVLSNPEVTNTELENRLNLTRRQISYSFSKINDWLEQNNYPVIKRTNGGRFIVSPLLFDLFTEEEEDTTSARYIPSEKERVQLIILMLLSSEEELSLIHFSIALEVSKNTALRDIKAAQRFVNDYQLEIVYSRKYGYDIIGNEWDKRKLLIGTLRDVFDIYKGELYIQQFGEISSREIRHLKTKIEEVERLLHLKFIDERIKLLPYIIAVLLKRIKKGQIISDAYHIDHEALSDTKEYEAAQILIQDSPAIPKQERMFITLQLLTSNVFSTQFLTDRELPQLRKSLEDSLELFEYKAAITLKNREALLNRLIMHMKPAYYRIKYQLTTNYAMLEKVSDEFDAIHYIVKDAIRPFREYIDCDIPESEIMYITILIGGHLLNSGETIPVKKKAIVVCPNGVSISQLMEHTLRDLFPEFYFYQAFSIREFEQLDLEFDLVFSPVPLQTNKHLFIVNQFISEFEKTQLRQRVMQGVFGLNTSVVNIDQIISIVEKYAKIEEKQSLEKALQDYFSLQLTKEVKVKKDYILSDFITPEMMVTKQSVNSWEEAIEIASQPLLQNGAIQETYITTMKERYPTLLPHISLRMNIAIPHAKPEEGANSVGMSLLKIKDGIQTENGKLHLVVVIAAVDKKQHLNALLQLIKLAEMDDVVQKMIELDSKEDMFNLIKAYSK